MKHAISVTGLTKRFRKIHAVDNLSFDVRAGAITGFLGRNGSGKTTTLRMILGLSQPDQGEARFSGLLYEDIKSPWSTVGSVLDAESFHPGRTGRNHLAWAAAAAKLPSHRVDEVLNEVNLVQAADRLVKGYSLGMRQRLALATALLGDPETLILDEPANGLDPQGMHWLRELLLQKARSGKTVLLSSHVLSELSQFVDDIIVIENGKLVKQGALSEVVQTQGRFVKVQSPDASRFAEVLRQDGAVVENSGENELRVLSKTLGDVGRIALKAGVELHLLVEEIESLEGAFLRMTSPQANKDVI